MTETQVSRCDSCLSETAIHLLFPFPLAGRFKGVGFRCNICVDTENRLIAKYGMMRDSINQELDKNTFKHTDLSKKHLRNYIHLKNFPEDSNQVLPNYSSDKENAKTVGTNKFIEMQDRYMTTGEITKEELVNLITIAQTALEMSEITPERSAQTVYKQDLHKLVYSTFYETKEKQ